MRKTFTLLLPLLVLYGCAADHGSPRLVSMNYIDRDGMSTTVRNQDRLQQYCGRDYLSPQPYQKVLRVYQRPGSGDSFSILTSYHDNGQVKQYLEVVNNRASGTYREWHENGALRLECQVVEGLADLTPEAELSWVFHGLSKAWDEKGVPLACFTYCKGRLHGDAAYYHSTGIVAKHMRFENHQLEGVVEEYSESGQLRTREQYEGGELSGTLQRFWGPGVLAAEEEYDQGRLVSGRYWDSEGALVGGVARGSGEQAVFAESTLHELRTYQEGLQEGPVQVFDEEGHLARKYGMREGNLHGEEVIYWEPSLAAENASTPKLAITWHEGAIQGEVKSWYRNGQMESQREIASNKRDGLATAWYADGSVMLMEEYEGDRLVKGEYYAKGQRFPVSRVYEGSGTVTLHDAGGKLIRKVTYLQGKPVESTPS